MKFRLLTLIFLASCFGGGNLSPTGDITSVVAGTGISGGATVGAATLTLNMTPQTCSAGSHVSAATATGVFTCTADTVGVTNSAGNNVVTKSNGTNLVASSLTDNGTQISIASTVSLTTAGAGAFLQSSDAVYAYSGNSYLANGALNFQYNTNATATGYINKLGYNNGGSQFRDLEIDDGAAGAIATFTGSTKLTALAGGLTVATTLAVNGNSTFGDATTDTSTFNGTASLFPPASGRGFQIDNSLTAQTGGVQLFWGRTHGTFNTTTTDITNTAVFGQADATRSSGANSLINVGVYGTASGGQSNYGVWSDGILLVSAGAVAAFVADPVTNTVVTYGRVRDSSTAPTLTTCGTGPAVTGGSFGMRVTPGTGAPTSCTITFSTTYTTTPACVVSTEHSTTEAYISAASATAITITGRATANLQSIAVDIICVGDL